MRTYLTSEIAQICNIHSNTVRLYEQLNFIGIVERRRNGYRIFNDRHIELIKLVRLSLRAEVIQNGLRKTAIQIIRFTANADYRSAVDLAENYLKQIIEERQNAEKAIESTKELLSNKIDKNGISLKRSDAAKLLGITIDTLRNWELNGLLQVKRSQNRYRCYGDKDLQALAIIKTLRLANYSLSAILRMLRGISVNKATDIKTIIDTPAESDYIISVCDQLISSLSHLEGDAKSIIIQIKKIENL